MDTYYNKYMKYKTKYLRLKGSGYEYLDKPKILLPKVGRLVAMFEEKLGDLSKVDALEVGIGNGRLGVALSPNFRSYVGLEPNERLRGISQRLCQEHGCPMEVVGGMVEDMDTARKFGLVLFVNSFHFTDMRTVMGKLKDMVVEGGMVYVKEPKIKPEGWGSDVLNEGSDKYDEEVWQRKKRRLEAVKRFLEGEVSGYGFSVEYVDGDRANVWMRGNI